MSKKYLLLFTLFVLIFSGCTHRKVRKVYQPIKHQSSYQTKHVQVAHSMSQLDQQSANSTPFYVKSYVKRLPQNVQFINLKPYRALIMQQINQLRAQNGVQSLGWSESLAKAALAHSRDMAVNNFLSHIGSGTDYDYARKAPGVGSNFYERIIFFGYPIKPGELAGEILTYTKDKLVGSSEPMPHFKKALANFLLSPKHREILLHPRFTNAGVAAFRRDDKIYWVILFGESEAKKLLPNPMQQFNNQQLLAPEPIQDSRYSKISSRYNKRVNRTYSTQRYNGAYPTKRYKRVNSAYINQARYNSGVNRNYYNQNRNYNSRYSNQNNIAYNSYNPRSKKRYSKHKRYKKRYRHRHYKKRRYRHRR